MDEEKKPEDTSQKNKIKKSKYKNLWPSSEQTKKPEGVSSVFKFGDNLRLH